MTDYFGSNALFYSLIYSNGIYEYNGDCVSLPVLSKYLKTEEKTPLLKNIVTGETYFLKKVKLAEPLSSAHSISQDLRYYFDIIRNPIQGFAEWPADIIGLPGEISDGVPSLRHFYDDSADKTEITDAALLFGYCLSSRPDNGGYPVFLTLDTWLYANFEDKAQMFDYNNQQVLSIAKKTVEKINEINKNKYLYFDFDFSRILLTTDYKLYFDFSNLMLHGKNVSSDSNSGCSEYSLSVTNDDKRLLPLDFIEPYLFADYRSKNSNVISLDIRTQNYSLAAMIFYLLLGHKPYSGSRLLEHQESDRSMHFAYLKQYYLEDANIDFIFDYKRKDNNNVPNDKSRIFFAREIELWEALPENIREMFLRALSGSSAYRRGEDKRKTAFPTPADWLSALSALAEDAST